VTDTISLSTDDGVARVVLDRPEKLNAINMELLGGLADTCAMIEADPSVRVVLITGAGRAFSAGADLAEVEQRAKDPDAWLGFMRLWHGVFDRVEALPVPVVAGVQGFALAGGLELTLVADLVVAERTARLGDQHANYGLVPGGGGSQRLPRIVGARRAKELILLGSWIEADEALAWGLVNLVVEPGCLAAELDRVATALVRRGRAAAITSKHLVRRSTEVDLSTGLGEEIAAVCEHMRKRDSIEGISAFLGKREYVSS
jgi:enoyl-CoA hydratase/carnithine racemase